MPEPALVTHTPRSPIAIAEGRLSRSARLTPAEFKTHRLRIEQGAVSLRAVLDGAAAAPLIPPARAS